MAAGTDDWMELLGFFSTLLEVLLVVCWLNVDDKVVEGVKDDKVGLLHGKCGGSGGTSTVGFFLWGIMQMYGYVDLRVKLNKVYHVYQLLIGLHWGYQMLIRVYQHILISLKHMY
jgi:hypothetical protein